LHDNADEAEVAILDHERRNPQNPRQMNGKNQQDEERDKTICGGGAKRQ